MSIAVSSFRYRARRSDERLRDQLVELAREKPRYGYRRLQVLMERDGERVNHKRLYRVYREPGLCLRRKKRKYCTRSGLPPSQATAANQAWALDFAHDVVAAGRTIRVLSVVPAYQEHVTAGMARGRRVGIRQSHADCRYRTTPHRGADRKKLPKSLSEDGAQDGWAFQPQFPDRNAVVIRKFSANRQSKAPGATGGSTCIPLPQSPISIRNATWPYIPESKLLLSSFRSWRRKFGCRRNYEPKASAMSEIRL
jgi:hypothetical protein